MREAPGKGTFVAGAANVEVTSREEVELLLEEGNAYRTTESTQLNMVSSRSHAVLQLRVHMLGAQQGKLSLIDLAGSERASKTGVMARHSDMGAGGTKNNNKRLTEGANINRSLLALANCISALADQAKRGGGGASTAHIPYRDSKLTRLLKDSLGGECRTLMIANVSPASDQFDETLNTLKYADRAKRIRTKDATQRRPARARTVPPPRDRHNTAAAVIAARRAQERQTDNERNAAERHLQRMHAGAAQRARQPALAPPPPRLTREESATVIVQRNARGFLARRQTMKLKSDDFWAQRQAVAGRHGQPRRRANALAQRKALSELAGDVPAYPTGAGAPGAPPPRAAARIGDAGRPMPRISDGAEFSQSRDYGKPLPRISDGGRGGVVAGAGLAAARARGGGLGGGKPRRVNDGAERGVAPIARLPFPPGPPPPPPAAAPSPPRRPPPLPSSPGGHDLSASQRILQIDADTLYGL